MFSRRLLIAAICGAALASCNTAQTHIGDEDAAFGEALKYDNAIQIINPAPIYAADAAQPGANGEVGQKAVERYRTDKVKKVEKMETTTIMSGSSGSGGGPQ